MCLIYVVLQVGIKSGARFGSTDPRAKYGGKGLGPKGGAKLKANFTTPLVPKSNVRSSASGSEGGQSLKGEESKKKVASGASGDCGGEDASSDDQGGVSARRCPTRQDYF